MQQMQFRLLSPPSYPLSCEFRTEGSYCWVGINYSWANHSYNATPCSYQENPIILLERFTSPGLLERYNYTEYIVSFIARLNTIAAETSMITALHNGRCRAEANTMHSSSWQSQRDS